jgi:hypothetical protein
VNDEEVLAAVRDRLTGARESLGGVHMERPASAVMGRARSRRLRRALAAAGTGALAAGVALGLTLGGALGGQAGAQQVHANLDAWSVNTGTSGTVYVTIRELRDPAALRAALAKAGVPAVVSFGEFSGASRQAELPQLHQVLGITNRSAGLLLTIKPAAMPAGSELDIGVFDLPATAGRHAGLLALFGLYPGGTPLTHRATVSVIPDGLKVAGGGGFGIGVSGHAFPG